MMRELLEGAKNMELLSDSQLLELLNDIESDTSERKRSFKGDTPDTTRQAICAFANDLPYDLYPVTSATIADLSQVLFEVEYLPRAFAPDILAENNRSYAERLASCGMILSPDDTTPTIHGLLAIGKEPQKHIPGAYIQFLRLDGIRLADEVIDEATIGGSILKMMERLDNKLIGHNRRAFDITSGPTHKITETYPISAIQQIVYNAVMHRSYERTNAPVHVYWYDDRIEIISPGGLYGNVTFEKLGKPGVVDYRNPNLAATMKVFDIVQRFGRGITIARDAMERNGNPEPEFHADQSLVTCILKAKPNGGNTSAN